MEHTAPCQLGGLLSLKFGSIWSCHKFMLLEFIEPRCLWAICHRFHSAFFYEMLLIVVRFLEHFFILQSVCVFFFSASVNLECQSHFDKSTMHTDCKSQCIFSAYCYSYYIQFSFFLICIQTKTATLVIVSRISFLRD